jgi:hypothetical protein
MVAGKVKKAKILKVTIAIPAPEYLHQILVTPSPVKPIRTLNMYDRECANVPLTREV